MPHDEFWIVQDDGTVYGQCTTCGWTTSRYPNNGIIPNQLTDERMRHTAKPNAPTLDLHATEVSHDDFSRPHGARDGARPGPGQRPDALPVER